MSIIKTERLRLRPFKESDAAALLAYLSNPRVNCFKDQQLSGTEDTLKFIAAKQAGYHSHFGSIEKGRQG